MATVQVRSLATWVFALTLIGWANVSIAEEAGANRNKAVAQQSAAGRSAEAQAYVAQFTKKNPDACFKNVDLKDTKLQGPAGGIGPRVPPTRVIVMIDGSGSMAGRMGGKTGTSPVL